MLLIECVGCKSPVEKKRKGVGAWDSDCVASRWGDEALGGRGKEIEGAGSSSSGGGSLSLDTILFKTGALFRKQEE